MNKITLVTDVDGVLLNWFRAFNEHAETLGWKYKTAGTLSETYGQPEDVVIDVVNEFNRSARSGFLDAFRDSKYWFPRIHQEFGIDIVAVTSFGGDRYSRRLRRQNLLDHFGDVFEDIRILAMAESKHSVFESIYKARGPHRVYLAEDDPKQALSGVIIGMETFVMRHDYNLTAAPRGSVGVDNWQEIWEYFKRLTADWPYQDGFLPKTQS